MAQKTVVDFFFPRQLEKQKRMEEPDLFDEVLFSDPIACAPGVSADLDMVLPFPFGQAAEEDPKGISPPAPQPAEEDSEETSTQRKRPPHPSKQGKRKLKRAKVPMQLGRPAHPNGTHVIVELNGKKVETRVVNWNNQETFVKAEVEPTFGQKEVEREFFQIVQFGNPRGRRVQNLLNDASFRDLAGKDFDLDVPVAQLEKNESFLKMVSNLDDSPRNCAKAAFRGTQRAERGLKQGKLLVRAQHSSVDVSLPPDGPVQWVESMSNSLLTHELMDIAECFRLKDEVKAGVVAYLIKTAEVLGTRDAFLQWAGCQTLRRVAQQPWFFGVLPESMSGRLREILSEKAQRGQLKGRFSMAFSETEYGKITVTKETGERVRLDPQTDATEIAPYLESAAGVPVPLSVLPDVAYQGKKRKIVYGQMNEEDPLF